MQLTNVETYTELGNTESSESENQYDSILRQKKLYKHECLINRVTIL